MRRNSFVKQLRFEGLEDSCLFGTPQSRHIHCQENVGWTVYAFAFDALEKRVLAAFDTIDFDTRGFCVAGIESLIGSVVTRGIKIEHLLLGQRLSNPWSQHQYGSQSNKCENSPIACRVVHLFTPFRIMKLPQTSHNSL